MPGIYLDVPYVTHLAIGGNVAHDDWVGCWYASACMLGHCFEAGPRLGDTSLMMPDGSHDAIAVATERNRNENLVEVPQPLNKRWTTDGLAELVRKWGPLHFSPNKTAAAHWRINAGTGNPELASFTHGSDKQTYGHCCALIGAEDEEQARDLPRPGERAELQGAHQDVQRDLDVDPGRHARQDRPGACAEADLLLARAAGAARQRAGIRATQAPSATVTAADSAKTAP